MTNADLDMEAQLADLQKNTNSRWNSYSNYFNIYARRINEELMTINEVPTLWRDKVAAALTAQ